MRSWVLLAIMAGLLGSPAFSLSDDLVARLRHAQVVIAGEVHDNPAHHRQQAEIAAELGPRALVFEMLTAEQVAAAREVSRDDRAGLAAALGWDDSGWPDFDLYHPIIAAAPDAGLYGAWVPRAAAREAMGAGIAKSFGRGANRYGLETALPEAEQAAREADQAEAHCGALPAEMLPVMVELQRLRDAVLAREALRALEATGGPVLVIAGNGHARADRGVPRALALAAPGVEVLTIGQGEEGAAPEGTFDIVLDAPGVERPDPCEAFGD
ncbi:hypothetical protein E0K89_016730 [Aquicoccus sp. SCR17]|nr:hypothetical protein [Carideicomes alvinocaridis]